MASPARFVNAAISISSPPIAVKPLAISFTLISANILQTETNIFKPSAKSTMPAPEEIELLPKSPSFKNAATSAISTPTPVSPFANSFQFNTAKSLQADASTFIAAANITICVAPLTDFEPSLSITFIKTVIFVINPVTAKNAL